MEGCFVLRPTAEIFMQSQNQFRSVLARSKAQQRSPKVTTATKFQTPSALSASVRPGSTTAVGLLEPEVNRAEVVRDPLRDADERVRRPPRERSSLVLLVAQRPPRGA